MKTWALFGAVVACLFGGLLLVTARNPLSVVLIAGAVATAFATAFSGETHAKGSER